MAEGIAIVGFETRINPGQIIIKISRLLDLDLTTGILASALNLDRDIGQQDVAKDLRTTCTLILLE